MQDFTSSRSFLQPIPPALASFFISRFLLEMPSPQVWEQDPQSSHSLRSQSKSESHDFSLQPLVTSNEILAHVAGLGPLTDLSLRI
jgi:hypothetical protein